MLRLLADENFNAAIVRGLMLRIPSLDLVRVQGTGLRTADDPAILEWAANNDRILLTHDRATMVDFAYQRITNHEPMPGVFVINDRTPVGEVIAELLLITECSHQEEWNGIVAFLPL